MRLQGLWPEFLGHVTPVRVAMGVRTVGGVSTPGPAGCREGAAPGTRSENRRRGSWAEGVARPRGAQPPPGRAPQGEAEGTGQWLPCPHSHPNFASAAGFCHPQTHLGQEGGPPVPPPRCGWPPGHMGGQWRWVWNGKGQINACMTGEDVTSSLLGSGVENFAKVLEPLILPLVSISVPMAPYHHQHSGW